MTAPADGGARVAVTGATGTLGHALVPRLEDDERVAAVVAIASRPADPRAIGWRRAEYRRADVRDRAALAQAFAGAEAVVHLAFSLPGVRQDAEELQAVNVEGSLNAYAAAREAGARRFVYASSAAVYGFRRDSVDPIREDAPLRPEGRHFYAEHKVEVERRLRAEIERGGGPEVTFMRPIAIVGPHAAGAAGHGWPPPARALLGVAQALYRAGVRAPLPPLPVPLQALHERDAAEAFARAALGDGEPGTYNLSGEGVVSGADAIRAAGFPVLPVSPTATLRAVRALDALPKPWPVANWLHALTGPVIVDTTAARERLGWRPRYSSAAALATLRRAFAGRGRERGTS